MQNLHGVSVIFTAGVVRRLNIAEYNFLDLCPRKRFLLVHYPYKIFSWFDTQLQVRIMNQMCRQNIKISAFKRLHIVSDAYFSPRTWESPVWSRRVFFRMIKRLSYLNNQGHLTVSDRKTNHLITTYYLDIFTLRAFQLSTCIFFFCSVKFATASKRVMLRFGKYNPTVQFKRLFTQA